MSEEVDVPRLIATVLDAADARELAEFYRRLLAYDYADGDEPPAPGEPDPKGREWLVLNDANGVPRLAFQHVAEVPPVTWRDPAVAQQLHLDLAVSSPDALRVHRDRAVELGARVLEDRVDDPVESLCVLADPAGHPFCLLVPGSASAATG